MTTNTKEGGLETIIVNHLRDVNGYTEGTSDLYSKDEAVVKSWLETFLVATQPAEAVRHLRADGLVEGRVPHLHVSAKIAVLTGREAEYIKSRQKPSKHYHSLILDYLEKFEYASREKINELLIDEIRGQLSREEKLEKTSNILSCLRINKKIANIGTKHDPNWVLFTSSENQDRIQEKTQIGS